MAKIVKEELPIEMLIPSDSEVDAMFADEPLKQELIEEHRGKGDKISVYKQGEFADLCAGPHLMSTAGIKGIKLLSCTGAYWRGDSNNRMLSRIYGVTFPTAAELTAHLERLEYAKLRDHNKIGRELGYFTPVDYIGQGLPIYMQKRVNVSPLLQILSEY